MPILMDAEDCSFEGKPVRISESAITHLRYEGFDVYTLCDMLATPVDCPKRKGTGKPFRKTSRRVCSRRNGHTYNIILDPYPPNDMEYWSVSHLEPI
ncbi:hypothetical protein JS82_08085 [Methanomassiliicoccaceae archaeon DOK]|nr:hypothetical protein JS82_08085 [Methanomassiliicoccaceae archaeon DOK]